MNNELTTNVRVDELIKKIEENKKRHIELYNEAMIGYRKNIIEAFSKKLNDAKEGKDVYHHIDLSRPESREQEYDCLLGMLRMTIEQHMVLTRQQFMQYVNDQWSWKGSFINSCNPHGVKLSDIESSYLD